MAARRYLGMALLALIIAACATPTSYQRADPEFGYSEQQLQSNRFRVTFRGNSLTSRGTVENYLLLRAAELTLEQEFDRFIIAQRNLESSTSYVYAFHDFPHHGFYRMYPYGYRGGTTFANAWPSTSYEAVAEIVMMNEPDVPADARAFDPRELIDYLRPKTQSPGGDNG